MISGIVIVHSDDDSYLGLSVRSYARDAAQFCDDLHGARRYIENSIAMMPQKNHVNPVDAYRVYFTEDCKTVEVWHYNVKGDKDRLLLTIKEG